MRGEVASSQANHDRPLVPVGSKRDIKERAPTVGLNGLGLESGLALPGCGALTNHLTFLSPTAHDETHNGNRQGGSATLSLCSSHGLFTGIHNPAGTWACLHSIPRMGTAGREGALAS